MTRYLAILPISLLFGACAAPKGIVLREAVKKSTPANSSSPGSYAASTSSPAVSESPTPQFNPGIGLRDPSNLTSLPSDTDMKPTVGDKKDGPVIAKPPSGSE